jgi:heme/copper-type cytochrome/quinol oxidase subunit 2
MNAGVVVFYVAAAVCALAHVGILVSVVRRASTVADSSVPRPKAFSEIAWALIPAIALAFVLTATWSRVREQPSAAPAPVMKIAR